LLLHLGHQVDGDRPHLNVWLLLTHQAINHIEHLIAKTGLAQCSHASGERERPQHR
jgi:hypothetical protein